MIITIPVFASNSGDEISLYEVKDGDTIEWAIIHSYGSSGNLGEYRYKIKYEITEVNHTLDRINGHREKEFVSGDQETFDRLHGDDLITNDVKNHPIVDGIELDERPIEVLNPNYWSGIKSEYSDGVMENYSTASMEYYYFRNVSEYYNEDYSKYSFGKSFEWSKSDNWGNMSSIYFKYDFIYKKSDGLMYEHQYYKQHGEIVSAYSISLVKKNYLPIPFYSSPMFITSIVVIIAILIIYYRLKYQRSSN